MNNLIILFGLALIIGATIFACAAVASGANYDAAQHAGEDRGEGFGGLHSTEITQNGR